MSFLRLEEVIRAVVRYPAPHALFTSQGCYIFVQQMFNTLCLQSGPLRSLVLMNCHYWSD